MKISKTALRWIVLFSVIFHIVYSNVYDLLSESGYTIQGVTYLYPSIFTPAGFTFAIWGVIYVAFLIYAIYQLTPKGRSNSLCDSISVPMIAANLLSCLWIGVFSHNDISLSVIIIAANLVVAARLFTFTSQTNKHWLRVPFSLYFGWLTVATMANISTWLVSTTEAKNGYPGEVPVTILMLLIALVVAVFISHKYDSRVYAWVVSWAAFGIWFANKDTYLPVAYTAVITSVILITWTVYLWTNRFRSSTETTPDLS